MKLGFGIILLGIGKAIIKLFNVILTVVAYLLLYLGLWVPCAYLLLSLILWLGLGLDLSTFNADAVLFYVGLALSIACSVVIIIRNFLLKPIKKFSDVRRRNKAMQRREIVNRAAKLKAKNPDKYYQKYGDTSPYDVPDYHKNSKSLPDKSQAERPIIYRSARNKDIIIHEFHDRFEVFTDINGTLDYIETKPKLPNR